MAARGLSTYEDWLHCLVALCRIRPTPEYVAARLAELRNERALGTRKFVESWGEPHRLRVIAWFERLERELREAPPTGPDGRREPRGAPPVVPPSPKPE